MCSPFPFPLTTTSNSNRCLVLVFAHCTPPPSKQKLTTPEANPQAVHFFCLPFCCHSASLILCHFCTFLGEFYWSPRRQRLKRLLSNLSTLCTHTATLGAILPEHNRIYIFFFSVIVVKLWTNLEDTIFHTHCAKDYPCRRSSSHPPVSSPESQQ